MEYRVIVQTDSSYATTLSTGLHNDQARDAGQRVYWSTKCLR